MSVANNDIIRVDVLGDLDTTNQIVNSYQFQVSSTFTLTNADVLTDLATLLRAMYDAVKALTTVLTVWRRIRVQNITSGLLVGEQDFATPVAGGSSGEQGAFQSAGLVSFKTAVPRVVMRKYLPVSEAATGPDGKLTAAAVALLATMGTTLLNPLVGASTASYRFGYLSPKTQTFEVPNSRLVSQVIATQRRRRPGVGS